MEVDDELKNLYTLKIPTPSIRYEYSAERENFTEFYEYKSDKDGGLQTRELVDRDKDQNLTLLLRLFFSQKKLA